MAATLPKYVSLQSQYNHKYLQFVYEEGDSHGFLQFSSDDVVGPYTKFEVQVSEADQTLVHLRSCYNNKYWVPSTEVENWVLAAADDPEEDQTKLSCTLFRPTLVGDDKEAVRFVHVNTNKYVASMDKPDTNGDTSMYLASESLGQVLHDVCIVIDRSSLVIFPQNIAIKGGPEGKYLCARPINESNYLQFVGDDLADPTVGQEVFTSGDGNISIKSLHYNKFWTRTTHSFVLADTQDNDVTNQNILFSLSKIRDRDNVFTLKSLGNNDYCKSIDIPAPSVDSEVPVLSAADATVTTLSRLEVVDRAISWSVALEDSDFRVSDVRIPTPTFVVLGTKEIVNDSEVEVPEKMLVFFEQLSTRSWSSTINGSLKVGVTTVHITSPATDIWDGQVTIAGSITSNTIWGAEETQSMPWETPYEGIVPARTKAILQITGNKWFYDIPFSYRQTVTFSDGSVSSSRMYDGIYTGTQTYFEEIKVKFVPMD